MFCKVMKFVLFYDFIEAEFDNPIQRRKKLSDRKWWIIYMTVAYNVLTLAKRAE